MRNLDLTLLDLAAGCAGIIECNLGHVQPEGEADQQLVGDLLVAIADCARRRARLRIAERAVHAAPKGR